MPEPQGRILPAGSRLVQFEAVRRCATGVSHPIPRLVWVDRNPAKGNPKSFGCGGKTTFSVKFDENGAVKAGLAVCLCMGRFVE